MAKGIESLIIYRMAEELDIAVHELTKTFPPDERYRSVDQIRRSSSSVTNNIAEMYNQRSTANRIRMLNDLCRGEAEETRTNLIRCTRKGFCDVQRAEQIANRYTELMKAISGFIRYLKSRPLTPLGTRRSRSDRT